MPNEQNIKNDCDNNYSVLSEGLQTILRKNNIENGYEIIKKYFRNNSLINKEKF